MSSEVSVFQFASNKSHSKQLKAKAAAFLQSSDCSDELVQILSYFKECLDKNNTIIPCLLAVESIFAELLRKNELQIEIEPLKPLEATPENQRKEWLQKHYKIAYDCVIQGVEHGKIADSTQSLVVAMKLLTLEGKHPVEIGNEFPVSKLRRILNAILSSSRDSKHLINRFLEYLAYLDVQHYFWKVLPVIVVKEQSPSHLYIQNCLDLMAAATITKEIQENQAFLCKEIQFEYQTVRKNINKTWSCVMLWNHNEATHKQLLVLLLEKMLTHLDKPVLLTDFLMDSIDVGGAISLLALQGIFVLIQQHNLTYPNIYEKLYSMFEPEIFHTKYKARLFYLADIFLSSSHLPEGLVAAFVKRLARLALIAPPQDVVIICQFIGNLILRHPALKRLMFHPSGAEISQDPFIMEERDPTKSNALDSSLWEIASLQSHILPSVATAAKFISHPLPSVEWNIGNVLEINENDIFDKEITKAGKDYAVAIDRPMGMFTSCAGGGHASQFWKLY